MGFVGQNETKRLRRGGEWGGTSLFWCWFFRYGGGGVFTAFAQHTLMMMFLGASKYTPLAITTGMLSANLLEIWMIAQSVFPICKHFFLLASCNSLKSLWVQPLLHERQCQKSVSLAGKNYSLLFLLHNSLVLVLDPWSSFWADTVIFKGPHRLLVHHFRIHRDTRKTIRCGPPSTEVSGHRREQLV